MKKIHALVALAALLVSTAALADQYWQDSAHLVQRSSGAANTVYSRGKLTFVDGPNAGQTFEIDYPLLAIGTNGLGSFASPIYSNLPEALSSRIDSIAIGWRNRIQTNLTATQVSAASTNVEALVSFTKFAAGATVTGQTHYTISNGKTLRITTGTFCSRTGAGATNQSLFNLRNNVAGATTTASPLVLSVEVPALSSTQGAGQCVSMPFPDGGLEFIGDGTNDIGVSLVASSTNVATISLVGYEYQAP